MRLIHGCVLALILASLPCHADRVVLRTGAEITGVVVTEERSNMPVPGTLVSVTVALRHGGMVTIKGEDVVRIERGEKTVWQEYEERTEAAGLDPEAHLALATWCRERGLHREAAAELWIVLDLLPEDERAVAMLLKLGWRRETGADGREEWVSPADVARREAEARRAEEERPRALVRGQGDGHDQPATPPPDPAAQVVDGGKMRVGAGMDHFGRWGVENGKKNPDDNLDIGWGTTIRWFQWSDPAHRKPKPADPAQPR